MGGLSAGAVVLLTATGWQDWVVWAIGLATAAVIVRRIGRSIVCRRSRRGSGGGCATCTAECPLRREATARRKSPESE